jgi:threonine dehydrogenase-like Zn-dependent dehydrogenase
MSNRLALDPAHSTKLPNPKTTMRAAIITAPRKVEIATVPIPEPKANQIRIRIEGCGVCASNIPPWEGRPWFTYPMPPGHLGHEAWGMVDAVGPAQGRARLLPSRTGAGAAPVREGEAPAEPASFAGERFGSAGASPSRSRSFVGERSGSAGASPSRAEGSPSRATRFQIGDRVAFLGSSGYAEYDVVDQSQAIHLPDALAGKPFPAEPLGCAVNIFRRSNVREGSTVAILGIGFLGAMLVTMAKRAGARVIAITRRPFSQDLARKLGADHVVPLVDDNWQVISQVAQLTNGSGGYDVHGFCDVVIECTGEAKPLEIAGEICAVRGRLVIAGYHQDGPRTINLQLWNWRGLDVINAHERDPGRYIEGMSAAAEMSARGELNVEPLITHRFPLERLGEALEAARQRPNEFVKAIVTMTDS